MEEIFNIVAKQISGSQLSSAEEVELRGWLSIDENKLLYSDLIKVWKVTGTLSFDLHVDTDTEWENFQKLRDSKKVIPLHKRSFYKVSAIAASIVVLIGLVGFLLLNQSKSLIYQTADNTQQIQLPDNSQVWLNANSTLKIESGFNKRNRNVALSGEAYFEVSKNKELPFVIHTKSGLQAKVLGTRFNLQVNEQTEQWKLDVFSGRVWFGMHKKAGLVVEKEQQAIYNVAAHKVVKQNKFNPNAVAWKTNELIFDNSPITEVATQLSAFLGKQVLIPNHQSDLRYSGSFSNPSEKDVAEVLALAMGWEYKITNKALIFSKKN